MTENYEIDLTPEEIAEYKSKWLDKGYCVRLHQDLVIEAKTWCRRNIQRWQWSMDCLTGSNEHTFLFESWTHASNFREAFKINTGISSPKQ